MAGLREALRLRYEIKCFMAKRNVAGELMCGLEAMKRHREGKITLPSHKVNGPKKTTTTIRIEVDLLRELRALAAEKGVSVNALLAASIQELVQEQRTYDRSRKRAIARLHRGFDLRWKPLDSRDALHLR